MNNTVKYTHDKLYEIADGIYWVGYYEKEENLLCNPYLIVDNNEAVIIDGGSRPDFPVVMMKILQSGTYLANIKALIYQHYDPDLCGSIHNFEELINKKDLKIISHITNKMFLKHYSYKSDFISTQELNDIFTFSSGRKLVFINTPYAHTEGNIATYDTKTKTLFSSDLFGSYSFKDDIFLNINNQCFKCTGKEPCPLNNHCSFNEIKMFHQHIFPTKKVIQWAINEFNNYDIDLIAPQHGAVIKGKDSISLIKEILLNLDNVGIDNCKYSI